MDLFVKKLQSYPFSNKDMMALVENKANLVTYPQIKNYKSIDQLLGNHKACIILYMTSSNFGHWCLIFKDLNNSNLCHFFDPYGYQIDQELLFNSPEKNYQLGQDKPYLSLLLQKSKCKVISSPYKLQKFANNNNVCGRYVGARLQLRNITDKSFAKLFLDNKCYGPDWFVTILTAFIA